VNKPRILCQDVNRLFCDYPTDIQTSAGLANQPPMSAHPFPTKAKAIPAEI